MAYYNRVYGEKAKAIVKIKCEDRYYLTQIVQHLEERYDIEEEWTFLFNRGEPGVHAFIHIKGEKEEEV